MRLKERVNLVLELLPILPLLPNMAKDYGIIRTHLERIRTPIGGNDLLIATHALNKNLTVVTKNVREFIRVPNLKVENWL